MIIPARAPGMLPTRAGGENKKGRFPLPDQLDGSGPGGRCLRGGGRSSAVERVPSEVCVVGSNPIVRPTA